MTMSNNDEYGGVYFDPNDQELIKEHLLPKLNSKDEDGDDDLIVMKNVYEKEPWLLDHNNHPLFKKNEWFYFVTRTQVSVKKTGCGKNSKRRICGDNDGWSWKANAKKDITDEETKKIIGKKQTLKFTKSDNNNKKKKQKRGEGTSSAIPGSNSSWLMDEYSLPDDNMFHELVLCKIRKISNSKDDDDDHHEDSESVQASSSAQQQQQPLVCHGGEGNMVHQIDTFSMIETVPQRSSQQVEAMEVTHNVEDEDLVGDLFHKFANTGLDDQQQAPVYALSQTSAPPARLGDKSLPIQVDDDDDEDEELNQELDKFLF